MSSTSKVKKPSASQRKKAKARKQMESKLSEKCTEDNSSKDKNEHDTSDAGTSHQNQSESKEREINAEEYSSECKKELDSSFVDATSSTVDAIQSNLVTLFGGSVQVQDNRFLLQNRDKAAGTLETDDKTAVILEKITAGSWGDCEMDDDFSDFRPLNFDPAFSMQPETRLRDKFEETWRDTKARHPPKRQQFNHSDMPARRVFQVPNSYADQRTNTPGGFKLPYNRSGTNDKWYGKPSASTSQTSGETKPPREPLSSKDAGLQWANNPAIKGSKPPAGSRTVPSAGERSLPLTSVWAETFNKNKGLAGAKKQISKDSNPPVESVPAESKDSKPPQAQISSVVPMMSNMFKGPNGAEKPAKTSGQTGEKAKIPDNARGSQNVHHFDGHAPKPPQGQTNSVVPTMSNKNNGLNAAQEAAKTSGQTDEKTNVPDNARESQIVHGHAHPVKTAADCSTDFDRAFSDYLRYLRQNWDAALASPDCIALEEYDKRVDNDNRVVIRDESECPGSP